MVLPRVKQLEKDTQINARQFVGPYVSDRPVDIDPDDSERRMAWADYFRRQDELIHAQYDIDFPDAQVIGFADALPTPEDLDRYRAGNDWNESRYQECLNEVTEYERDNPPQPKYKKV